MWQSGAPWIESVEASRPYWVIRTHAAVLVAGGFIALLAGLTTGPRGGGLEAIESAIEMDSRAKAEPAFSMAGGVS
ncbi:hypothetical protein D3C83_158340 [compost metagenome]